MVPRGPVDQGLEHSTARDSKISVMCMCIMVGFLVTGAPIDKYCNPRCACAQGYKPTASCRGECASNRDRGRSLYLDARLFARVEKICWFACICGTVE